MLRSLIARQGTLTLVATPRAQPIAIRAFATSSPLFKKEKKDKGKSKGKKAAAAAEEEPVAEEDPSLVLTDLESQYKDVLKQFKEKVSVTKLGNSNPKIFDSLEVPLSHKETVNFLNVAQTSMKGRNLIITVFDPNNTKHIVSAVLAAGLNLNPEAVPNVPQQLKVALPPPTAETRKEIAKDLKAQFEEFKNSNKFSGSLSAKRADALKELKQFKKNDAIKKVTADLEKLHKKYTNDLQELFKAAEKQVLN